MEKIRAYLDKKGRFETELAKDLEGLYTHYDPHIVKKLIAEITDQPVRRSRPRHTSDVVEAPAEPKKRGRKPKNPPADNNAVVVDGLDIKSLKPLIEKALEDDSLNRMEFTRADIDKIVQEQNPGIQYEPSYASTILRTHDRLEKVGTKSSGTGGPPLNVYRIVTSDDSKPTESGNHQGPVEAVSTHG
jgi:hypothetical protein